jgi:GTP-binding protein
MKDVKLWQVVGKSRDIPFPILPQVAFAGRSNVGKSSLINRLMGRRKLARTSRTPGKTRTINYFLVDDRYLLVDLPGYGYAKVSMKEREAWRRLIESFLHRSPGMTRLVQLVDIRHKPTELDAMLRDFVDPLGIQSLVVATKADKISRGARGRHLEIIRSALPTAGPPLPFSAETGEGAAEIRRWIEAGLVEAPEDLGKA